MARVDRCFVCNQSMIYFLILILFTGLLVMHFDQLSTYLGKLPSA